MGGVLEAMSAALHEWRYLHFDVRGAVFYMPPEVAAAVQDWTLASRMGRIVASEDVGCFWAVLSDYVLRWGSAEPLALKEADAWLRWSEAGWVKPARATAVGMG